MSDNKVFTTEVKLSSTKCPYCFTVCGLALPLRENGQQQTPQNNSLLVCEACTKVSRFNANGMLVRILDAQLQQVLGNNPVLARQVLDLQMAAQKLNNSNRRT